MCSFTSVILVLERIKQERVFKASICYKARPCAKQMRWGGLVPIDTSLVPSMESEVIFLLECPQRAFIISTL